MNERLTSLASVVTGFLSAICWLGPAVFFSLGLSGIGLSAITAFTPYRVPLMVVTVLLLGLSHYLAYKKSRRGTARVNHTVLWISTVVAVGMMTYTLVNRGM